MLTRTMPITTIAPLLLGALLLTAPFAVASDRERSSSRVVFIGGDGDHATVTLDGGSLQVVAIEDGDVAVHEFDFSQLGALIDGAVSAAMANLDEVFDEELTIHVDDDRMIHVAHGDQACAVNLDVLSLELRNALSDLQIHVGQGFDRQPGARHEHEQDDTDDLRAELDELKAELEHLRSELDRVR